MTSKRLAGIDIGTLTCRLLIADLRADNRLNELCSERRILRLGEGVDQSKRLKHEAVDRVIHCLKDWLLLSRATVFMHTLRWRRALSEMPLTSRSF
jgi:exopolyphosphatase/pppGpp-phosphohydrolase